MGVSTIALPFCTSYVAFAVAALSYGFFAGTFMSLTSIGKCMNFNQSPQIRIAILLTLAILRKPLTLFISITVLVDLLGLDNLNSAIGLIFFFRGVTSMVGPPLGGFVFDATQSYTISFIIAGGSLILASLISFGAQILQRRRQLPTEK